MPDITNSSLASLFDETSGKLRDILGSLEGVSGETLEGLDLISYPRQDTPPPHNEEATVVYNRLLLLALAEAASHRESKQSKKRS